MDDWSSEEPWHMLFIERDSVYIRASMTLDVLHN